MTRVVRSSAFLLVLFAVSALFWRYHASSNEAADSLELATPLSTGGSSPSGWLFNVFGDANLARFESLAGDPDAIRLPELSRLIDAAGFVLEERIGPRFGYFARFRPAR